MKKLFYFLCIVALAINISSCKKDKTPTLQEYLVESKQNPNYVSYDISTSMIQGRLGFFDEEIQESIKSVRKVNLAIFRASENEEEYEVEKTKLDAVFKATKKYRELVKVKKQGIKVNLFYKGTLESINEVVVYAYAKEYGLGVARLTGKNIKTEKLIGYMNKTEIPQEILDGMKVGKLKVDPIE